MYVKTSCAKIISIGLVKISNEDLEQEPNMRDCMRKCLVTMTVKIPVCTRQISSMLLSSTDHEHSSVYEYHLKHKDNKMHNNISKKKRDCTFSLILALHASFLLERWSIVPEAGTPIAGLGACLLSNGCRTCCLGLMNSSSLS